MECLPRQWSWSQWLIIDVAAAWSLHRWLDLRAFGGFDEEQRTLGATSRSTTCWYKMSLASWLVQQLCFARSWSSVCCCARWSVQGGSVEAHVLFCLGQGKPPVSSLARINIENHTRAESEFGVWVWPGVWGIALMELMEDFGKVQTNPATFYASCAWTFLFWNIQILVILHCRFIFISFLRVKHLLIFNLGNAGSSCCWLGQSNASWTHLSETGMPVTCATRIVMYDSIPLICASSEFE